MSVLKKPKKITDFAKRNITSEEKKLSTGASKPVEESSDVEIEEILRSRMHKVKEIAGESIITDKKQENQDIQVSQLFNSDLAEKLTLIAREAALKMQVEFIECDKQGNCSDGKKVSEVFEDSRGVKWQRAFLPTSRSPIFLNFIAEDSKIIGRVGRALIIETSRGARAIIPEDYICELTSRYGIILNIDKCNTYKTSPWSDRGGRIKKEIS